MARRRVAYARRRRGPTAAGGRRRRPAAWALPLRWRRSPKMLVLLVRLVLLVVWRLVVKKCGRGVVRRRLVVWLLVRHSPVRWGLLMQRRRHLLVVERGLVLVLVRVRGLLRQYRQQQSAAVSSGNKPAAATATAVPCHRNPSSYYRPNSCPRLAQQQWLLQRRLLQR